MVSTAGTTTNTTTCAARTRTAGALLTADGHAWCAARCSLDRHADRRQRSRLHRIAHDRRYDSVRDRRRRVDQDPVRIMHLLQLGPTCSPGRQVPGRGAWFRQYHLAISFLLPAIPLCTELALCRDALRGAPWSACASQSPGALVVSTILPLTEPSSSSRCAAAAPPSGIVLASTGWMEPSTSTDSTATRSCR